MRSNIRNKNILFISQNNCLSFLAEAIANRLLPPKTQVLSASLKGGEVHPEIIRVLQEVGIDVPSKQTKRIDSIPIRDIDLIVGLGEIDDNDWKTLSPTKYETWELADPCSGPEVGVDALRQARDEIDKRVGGLFLDYWRNVA